jgi:hypothetical protein
MRIQCISIPGSVHADLEFTVGQRLFDDYIPVDKKGCPIFAKPAGGK